MPTDPSSQNQPAPVPLGQAHPNPQRIPQQQQHQQQQQQQQQPHHLPPHLHFPQQQPPHPIAHHQTQHLPRQRYASTLSSARNLPPAMQQSQLAQPTQQPPSQPQPQQPQALPRQPQRPPIALQEQPQHQYFAVNGAYALGGYPQVAQQFNLNANYVYPPFPYNSLPAGAAPQPGAPQPPAPRPYTPAVTQPGVPPRQQTPLVQPLAPAKKKILAIVDPDTNEEVMVSNADPKSAPSTNVTASAPVKIPTRTARPLELVADPADTPQPKQPHEHTAAEAKDDTAQTKDRSTAPAPDSVVSENKEEPIIAHSPATSDLPVSSPVEILEKAVPQDHLDDGKAMAEKETAQELCTSPVDGEATHDESMDKNGTSDHVNGTKLEEEAELAPVQKEDSCESAVTTTEKEVETTSSHEGGPISSEQVEEDPIQEKVHVDDADDDADDKESVPTVMPSDATNTGDTVADSSKDSKVSELPEEVSIPEVKEGDANGDASVASLTEPSSELQSASTSQDMQKVSEQMPKEESSSIVDDVDSETTNGQATPRRERPVFLDGERRVYPPHWMLSVRSNVDAKKAAEYISALSSNSIYKSAPASAAAAARMGDPRGSRTMRGGMGPLSGDPRGKRAFPQTGPGFMGPGRGAGPTGMVGSGGVGSYDAFDLRSARSQNPPPVPPKGQPGHMRDPRGSRQGGSRDRFDGPFRNGHGPIDPFINQPPVEKLKRSENGWKRNRESDDEVASKVKQIRSLLNKLTLEKFDKIFKQIIDIDISSYEILTGVVREVFEKALFEPKFSGMYAELCVRLDVSTREMLKQANIIDANGKPVFFRNILLNNCREEFTRFALEGENANEKKEAEKESTEEGQKEEEGDGLTAEQKAEKERVAKEEAETKAFKAKRRMLANVRFIGELFLKDLLKEHIIHRQCIQKLLAIGIETREEDVLEALCKLLSKTGAKLSMNKEAITHIDGYFKRLELMSRDHTLPARIRFMLQDLIEQRANGWKVRREEVGAKTIAEIHKDIEKEEKAKAEAQAAARERRPRGSGMHGRDRGPQNFPPRMAMTMASRQKPGGGVSRSAAILARLSNRTPSNVSPSFTGVRLTPGGSKGNPVSTSAQRPSLRPGGSRYSALAGLEQREISPTGPSGDARRNTGNRKWPPIARGQSAPKAEAVEVKPKLMSADALRKKTRTIIEEYWSIEIFEEAKECVEQEVQPPNYGKFIEEALKLALDGKMAEREKSLPFFVGLLEDTIPGKDFITGFSGVIAQLADIEMDNPRAAEFLAKYLGGVAATKKLGEEPLFGFEFLNDCLSEISDPKRASKLVVVIFGEFYKSLEGSMADVNERQMVVRRALNGLNVDLAAKMSAWNPMRGLSVLEDMLKDNGVSFLVPLLPVEKKLVEVLASEASESSVEKLLSSSGLTQEQLQSEALMGMVIRVSLDWLLMSPPASIKDVFGTVIGKPLVKALNGDIPRNVQMSAVLAAQSFVTSNLEILPPHSEGDVDKPGHIAFETLYFADVVDEETFLKWKDDTGKSTQVAGKDKMIIQTSGFFRWLNTAEVEE